MDQRKQKEFKEYVKTVTPTHNLGLQMLKAFLVGGVICTLGQFIINTAQNNFGLDKEAAGSWCSLILVFLSVLLTGLNIYPGIAKWGGAGALVPITGFANAIAAPAVEFKTEGMILGTAAKMFTIAGPVIVYGVSASVVYGFIYWVVSLL